MRNQIQNREYRIQNEKSAILILALCLMWLILPQSVCLGAEYYLDANNGNDSYDGLTAVWDGVHGPWRTVSHAQGMAYPSDIVFLRSGNYGSVFFDRTYNPGTSWGNHITYMADIGHTPVFDSLQVTGEDAYLEFDGIHVIYTVPFAGLNTAVQILDATHVRVKNFNVTGYWTDVKSDGITSYGIEVRGQPVSGVFAEDVLVEGCEVTDCEQGIVLKENIGSGVVIRNNHVHHIAASAITINAGNTETILIEGNHIHDEDPIWIPDPGIWSHGCGIALWAKNIHVKGNVIHDFGATHGIRTYPPLGNPAPPEEGYTNMLFENNLIYDTDNQYAVGFVYLGSNFTFRNNTIIGWHDESGEGHHYYKYPLFVESTAPNYDPSTVTIENNIILGEAIVPETLNDYYQDIFKNNIMYSFFISTSPRTYIYSIPDNIVVLQGYLDPLDLYFEGSDNFFAGGADFDSYSYTRPNGQPHGINLTEAYELAAGSPAIGYANSNTPLDDIDGNPRNDGAPDAGCYEYIRPIIADHIAARQFYNIPESWIEQAKKDFHIAYGHTSHGQQLIEGLRNLDVFMSAKGYPVGTYAVNIDYDNPSGTLDLRDQPWRRQLGWNQYGRDLGSGWYDDHMVDQDYTAWVYTTRKYLGWIPASGDGSQLSDYATGTPNYNSDVNVIIWAWCGQVSYCAEEEIQNYLDNMNQLEQDYPQVKFVYMTGHVNATGLTGRLRLRNEIIREYCRNNNKILYDFADIESYDPDGNYYGDKYVQDSCNYDYNGDGVVSQTQESWDNPPLPLNGDRNWALDWQESHTLGEDWYESNLGYYHTQHLNHNLKAYATWWMLARLAGWEGVGGLLYGDVSGDGQISAYDAALVAMHAVGLITLSDEQFEKADVTDNGSVSATDASWIARRAVDPGLKFPVEEP